MCGLLASTLATWTSFVTIVSGIGRSSPRPDWATRMSKAGNADYDVAVLGSLGEIADPDWRTNSYYGGEKLVRTNNSPCFDDPKSTRSSTTAARPSTPRSG